MALLDPVLTIGRSPEGNLSGLFRQFLEAMTFTACSLATPRGPLQAGVGMTDPLGNQGLARP
jgi:hypothetical protein